MGMSERTSLTSCFFANRVDKNPDHCFDGKKETVLHEGCAFLPRSSWVLQGSYRHIMEVGMPDVILRWLQYLSTFDEEVKYQLRKLHGNADGLIPCPIHQLGGGGHNLDCGPRGDEPLRTLVER